MARSLYSTHLHGVSSWACLFCSCFLVIWRSYGRRGSCFALLGRLPQDILHSFIIRYLFFRLASSGVFVPVHVHILSSPDARPYAVIDQDYLTSYIPCSLG